MGRTLLIILLLGTAGCTSTKLKIESDTQWSGSIGGSSSSSTYSGAGNREFDLEPGTTCWAIQKQTQAGRLRVYVEKHTITGNDTQGDATTTAAFGVVSGCGG